MPAQLSSQLSGQTWRILVLRVDFALESPDELSTTGTGKFDLRSLAAAIPDMRLPFDAPPHDRAFYQSHLEALAHYYDVVSEGRVRIEAEVFPRIDTLAYTLPGTILTYGNGRTPEEIGQLWVQLIRDATALADADPEGPLFSDYDSYLFIHAGMGFETGQLNDVRSVFLSAQDMAGYGAAVTADQGATPITSAWILPEVVVANGRAGLNGILAKFFGHQLGLPGLSNFAAGLPAVGGWSLMDVGANRIGFLLWNQVLEPVFGFVPPHPLAWSKARLGWIEPIVVERDTVIAILAGDVPRRGRTGERPDAVVADAVKAVQVPLSPMEYLLLSNRQQRGRLEAALPPEALAFDVETSWIDTDQVSFTHRITAAQNDTLQGRGAGIWLRIAEDAYDTFVPSSGVLVWHVDSTVFLQDPEFFNTERPRPALMLHEADGERDIGNAFFDRQDRTEGSRADAFFAGSGHDGEPGVTRFGPATRPSSYTHTGLDSGVEIEVLDPIGDVMRVAIRFRRSVSGWPVSWGPLPPAESMQDLGLLDGAGSDSARILVGSMRNSIAYGAGGQRIARWDGAVMAAGGGFTYLWSAGSLSAVDGAGTQAWSVALGNSDVAALQDSVAAVLFAENLSGFDGPVVVVATLTGLQVRAADSGASLRNSSIHAAALSVADLTGSGRVTLVAGGSAGLWRIDAEVTPLGTGAINDVLSGDIDGDGVDELVALTTDGQLLMWQDNKLSTVFDLGAAAVGNAALGDVDGDTRLEVVVATATALHVLELAQFGEPLLAAAGFPTQPPAYHEAGDFKGGVILADLDGDGSQEILLNAAIGVYAYGAAGDLVAGFPLLATAPARGTPVAVDVDGDGSSEIAALAGTHLHLWQPGRFAAGLTRGGEFAWPAAGADAANSHRHTLRQASPGTAVTSDLLAADRAYCYPNPVSGREPRAHVRFYLGADATVTLDVYDALGGHVEALAATLAGATEHELSWSVNDYASGLYLCRLQARDQQGGHGSVTLRMAVTQ